MDTTQALVIPVIHRLESQESALKELAAMTGALPGEVGIVIRLNRLPGMGHLQSMRTDFK